MTSLSDVAELVRVGNDDAEESNKTLKSIDAKFDKFFKLQERSRLDDLEARLDKSRAIKPRAVNSRGVLATVGAGASSMSDFFKAMLNPTNWLKALGIAALAPVAITAKKLVYGLRNAIDDRLKTQRGLLRIEADELKRAQTAERARLKDELSKEQYRKARIMREAKDRIAAAEKAYAQKKIGEAERARFIRAERLAKEDAAARVRAAKDALKEQKAYQRRLRVSINRGSTSTLSSVVAEGNQFYSSSRPDIMRNDRLVRPDVLSTLVEPTVSMDTPVVVKNSSPPPSVLTNANKLATVSDADLTKAGAYRVTQTDGRVVYKAISNNVFLQHAALLDDIQTNRPVIASQSAVVARTSDSVRNSTNAKFNTGVRVGSAALNPIEAAVQEAVEFGARSTSGAASKAFGATARFLGGPIFNAALLAIQPTTMGDGSISGPYQRMEENLVAAILSGDYKNVVAARDAMVKYAKQYGITAQDSPLVDFVKNAKEQELKTFTTMEYAKYHGKAFRANPIQAPMAYGSGKALQQGRFLVGDELNALDAIAANNALLGQNTAIGQVGDNNNTINNSGSVVYQGSTSTVDNLNGGSSFSHIGDGVR